MHKGLTETELWETACFRFTRGSTLSLPRSQALRSLLLRIVGKRGRITPVTEEILSSQKKLILRTSHLSVSSPHIIQFLECLLQPLSSLPQPLRPVKGCDGWDLLSLLRSHVFCLLDSTLAPLTNYKTI